MDLSQRVSSRTVILLGGVIAITSVFIASFTRSTAAFFFFYAGGFGIGKGFLYPAPLNAGWSHLPGRKGLVSGIIVSGLGIGSFIFGIVA